MIDNIRQKIRTFLGAVNTWLVVAAGALAVLVNQLTPLADVHPAIEWTVRAAGAAGAVVAAAIGVLRRSTEVPGALRGLSPRPDPVSVRWGAWDGGRFAYIAPPRPDSVTDLPAWTGHPSTGGVGDGPTAA